MGQKHAVVSVADTSETGKAYSILSEIYVDATKDAVYVCGDQIGRGRCGWVTLTRANTASQKNTAIMAFLQG